MAKIFSLKRIRLQLFRWVALLSMVTGVSAETCGNIVGLDAVNTAAAVGFQFEVSRKSESGHCIKLMRGSAIHFIVNGDGPVICHVRFFTGMSLSEDWRIVPSPKFDGNFKYTETGRPQYETQNPYFEVEVSSEQDGNLVLESIVLEGPDCDDWKQAFNQGS